ncbi:hypothetical protein LCGC14_2248020 [marine sediment metagenome]|uniref:Uncharacterized protein n=1 Tax=marine sediment metagenome TaxID=412755 RepID=A0A0F9DQW1_9ZZZZ
MSKNHFTILIGVLLVITSLVMNDYQIIRFFGEWL